MNRWWWSDRIAGLALVIGLGIIRHRYWIAGACSALVSLVAFQAIMDTD
ncbi:MAG: hypothetical protein AAF619_12550 [Pseudomonadota bacterium]